MADGDVQVYALDDAENKHTTLTTAQILSAIAEAIQTGEIPENLTSFIDEIREQNKSVGLKFWLGTTAEFTSLASTDVDTIYLLTDNTSLKDLDDAIVGLQEQLEAGDIIVGSAKCDEDGNNIKNTYVLYRYDYVLQGSRTSGSTTYKVTMNVTIHSKTQLSLNSASQVLAWIRDSGYNSSSMFYPVNGLYTVDGFDNDSYTQITGYYINSSNSGFILANGWVSYDPVYFNSVTQKVTKIL